MVTVLDLEGQFLDKEPMTSASPFERIEVTMNRGYKPSMYQSVFGDHSHREGAMINHLSILRMRVERNEALGRRRYLSQRLRAPKLTITGGGGPGFVKHPEHHRGCW